MIGGSFLLLSGIKITEPSLNSEREKRIDAERKIEESKKQNQEVERQLNEALQELDYLKKKQGIVYKD